MMTCQVVQDLLPLYVDGVVSEESEVLITEHTATCELCQKELEALRTNDIGLHVSDESAAQMQVLQTLKKRIYKKIATVALSLVVVSLLVIGGVAVFFAFRIVLPFDGERMSVVQVTGEVPVWGADGVFQGAQMAQILELSVPENYSSSVASRQMLIDGEETHVIAVYFFRTLAGRLPVGVSSADGGTVGSGTGSNTLRLATSVDDAFGGETRVYYFIGAANQSARRSDEEFYELLQQNATLLWQGRLSPTAKVSLD